ncbi:MAG: MFS transporter [Firmicutes bacterium]|nr:MFS transporter [Bacillota bacterium]
MAKKPLSDALKKYYGVGVLANVLRGNMGTYYQTYWLTDVAMFPLPLVAVIQTVSSIVRTFINPLLGGIVDAMPPINRKWGRYRSWLIVGSVASLIGAPFMWLRLSSDDQLAAILYIVIGLLASIPGSIMLQANSALIPLICSTPEEKSLLASRSFMYQNIGRLISSYTIANFVVYMVGKGYAEGTAYIVLSVIFAILTVLAFYAHFKMTEGYEGEGVEVSTTKRKTKDRASVSDIVKNFILNPPLMFLFVANIGTSTTSFIFSGMAAYYWRYVAENFAMMSVYTLCINIGGILGTILAGKLAMKYDTRKLSMVALCCMAGAFVLARMVALTSPILFTCCMVFHQFAASFNYPLFISMYASCVTYGEWKTGQNAAAFIMGLTNVPISIATTLRGIIIPMALASSGYVANQPATQAVKAGLVNIYVQWPMAFLALSFIIMAFFFRLSNERVKEMQAEIDARNLEA